MNDNLSVHEQLVAICDFASTADHGKVNLVGVFTTLGAYDVPVVTSSFSLVVMLTTDKASEVGPIYDFECKLTSPSGKEVTRSVTQVTALPSPVFKSSAPGINLIIHVGPVLLQEFGKYSFEITIPQKLSIEHYMYLEKVATPEA